KRTQALVEKDGARLQVSKGAPQVLAQMAGEDVSAQVDALAERGYRTIAVAVDTGDGWRLAGLIPLHDPPRPDSAKVLDEARQLGVEVKMLTGDHIAIAKEVASLLHLGSRIVNASEVAEKPYPEAARTIEQANGFAEVFPEHKYTIVDALQKHGHIVGMTGDGVNDAPALKKAEVGIAVAGATDAAKSAADIVLTSSGLSVVIDAIKESRRIFQRMQSYTIYRIAETVRLLFFITLAILVFNFYPVTTVMIILLALLNDVPILAIAYDRATCSSEPDRWHTDIVLTVATVLGILGVASSFGLFFIAERFMHLDLETIRTFMFLKLAVAGHLTIFLTRTRGYFWSVKPSAALFWAAVSTKLLATLVAVYGLLMAPIGWWLAILIWVYALAWFVLNDWVKVELYRLFESRLGRRLTRSARVA
ncbi:MAG: HAD-IC family P-type ATPase, partial [Methermicoccaceae archaeon]